jgi:hypothetical protein
MCVPSVLLGRSSSLSFCCFLAASFEKKIFLSFSLRLLLTHALITVIVFSRRGLRSEKNLHWIGFLPSTFSIYKSQPVSLYPMCLLRLEKIQPFALVMDGSKCALLPLACHFSLVALLWTVVDVRPFGAPSLSLSPLLRRLIKKISLLSLAPPHSCAHNCCRFYSHRDCHYGLRSEKNLRWIGFPRSTCLGVFRSVSFTPTRHIHCLLHVSYPLSPRVSRFGAHLVRMPLHMFMCIVCFAAPAG